MVDTRDVVNAILDAYPARWGQVVDRFAGSRDQYVIIFEDRPWDVVARENIALGLQALVRSGTVSLIAQDGACGEIDTSPLRSVPVASVREEVARRLLESMRISPGEYVTIMHPGLPILLCGVDDPSLYRASSKVWNSMPLTRDRVGGLFRSSKPRRMRRFLDLEARRAQVMVAALSDRLAASKDEGMTVAALVCTGNLPAHVTDLLGWRGTSCARIAPAGSEGDPDRYLRLSAGGLDPLEDLMSLVGDAGQAPAPDDGDWERLRVEEVHEVAAALEAGTSPAVAMPEMAAVLTSAEFRSLPLERRREVLAAMPKLPFSVLSEFVPVPELEEILGKPERWLRMEELMSQAELALLPEFLDEQDDLLQRLSEEEVQALIDSPIVHPDVKERLRERCALERERLEGFVAQWSAPGLEDEPDFERRLADLLSSVTSAQMVALMVAPDVPQRVKEALLKGVMLPQLRRQADAALAEPVKPQALGLGFLATVGVVLAILSGGLAELSWWPWLTTGLYAIDAAWCVKVGRHRLAAGLILIGLGTWAGVTWWGRWGLAAALAVTFLVALALRPDLDDRAHTEAVALKKLLDPGDP